MMTILTGHVSPETAYVVDDYPYGFRLRCKIRYWMETNKNGTRFCSQTTNPKVTGEVWNKPKASTYAPIAVMVKDESNGHISQAGVSFYSSPADFQRFRTAYGTLPADVEAKVAAMEKVSRKYNPNTWGEWDAKQSTGNVVAV